MEGQDFTSPTPLQIVFNATDPAGPLCAAFNILDDSVMEGDHEFTVHITDVGPTAVIASPDTTTVTIDDDEREHYYE